MWRCEFLDIINIKYNYIWKYIFFGRFSIIFNVYILYVVKSIWKKKDGF